MCVCVCVCVRVCMYIEQVLVETPHQASTIRPPASHHENHPS